MTWVMLFTWPLMAAIQEVSAGSAASPGAESPATSRQHYSLSLLYAIVFLLLVANIINLGADLGAMAEALRLLIGGPSHVYVVGFAVGCALLEVFVRYERYVSILKWTSLSLFAYVATALVVDVPWTRVVHNICRADPQLGQELYRSDRRSPRHHYNALTAFSGSPPRRRKMSVSTPLLTP